ncbi:MAG: DEAD/DEAH box helicase family protein [Brevinematales bacterium]|nr:DEAD/DEAH box helicase family protein [Brevinematales bacterium]
MKVDASQVFTESVIQTIAETIEKNSGHEVAFSGVIDRSGLVVEVFPLSYGNEDSTVVAMMEALSGDVVIHNHPSGNTVPSQEDIELSSLLANRMLGFYIVNNTCSQVNIVLQPRARVYLKDEEVLAIFGNGGELSKNIGGYETRPEQVDMVANVVWAVNDSKLLICEAGTGTGKSLSYLIPAAIWAVENKKRVMVSTHTINLQQQISEKDMEIVERVVMNYLHKPLHHAVLVGRGNYLCRRRLAELLRDTDTQRSLFESGNETLLLQDIALWTENTPHGTRGEYPEGIKEEIWEEIRSDTMMCSRKRCQFYSECFYYKARLGAERAHIVIANHSLVFSSIDEQSYRSMLPFYSGIVFDEAHHIEDAALRSLSQDFSFQSLFYHLRKLYFRRRHDGADSGLFSLLRIKGGIDRHIELRETYDKIFGHLTAIVKLSQEIYTEFTGILRKGREHSLTIGIDEAYRNSEDYRRISERLQDFFPFLNRFITETMSFINRLLETSSDSSIVDVIKAVGSRLDAFIEMTDVFHTVFIAELSLDQVRWIEVTPKNIRFSYSPLEVNDFLANALFSKKDFTVFTSATLAVNKKFDYFRLSTGVNLASHKEILELSLPSPFDFARQAEIYILEDGNEHLRVTDEKTDFVRGLCIASKGGVLALFTSYIRLTEMYGRLKDGLMEHGLLPIRQGDRARNMLLDTMKTHGYGVLFATSSFWEGIDIRGDNLRCVIIEKLPFDNPEDPIYSAKVALLDSKGVNSFISFSLPRAILRLKQGMGRLIRSKTDKGVIAIMDNRLRTKNYGKTVLNSLPPAKVMYGGGKSLIAEAVRFFGERFL